MLRVARRLLQPGNPPDSSHGAGAPAAGRRHTRVFPSWWDSHRPPPPVLSREGQNHVARDCLGRSSSPRGRKVDGIEVMCPTTADPLVLPCHVSARPEYCPLTASLERSDARALVSTLCGIRGSVGVEPWSRGAGKAEWVTWHPKVIRMVSPLVVFIVGLHPLLWRTLPALFNPLQTCLLRHLSVGNAVQLVL